MTMFKKKLTDEQDMKEKTHVAATHTQLLCHLITFQ